MTRWNLSIPEETDRAVRSFLARRGGKKGDLSKFANDAVRKEILRQTVMDIQEQNADLSEQEAVDLAQEAVAWTRAHRS
ncbi:MAG: methionine repressor-like protein [Candidatus Nitrohelix vancouverensis]|uniref:Methionine repressor-like protein n=1 Tax=Candidatus Nitrohelix vancouverensis TaxID=2705534 RepID=A0A7T0G2S8_9BACT|nr:MAG: methionine repressor-like protein [Candidatus Nitrohelix vancouverensis]